MPNTREISVTLPEQLATWVKQKVDAGEYASETDVITDALEHLVDDATSLDQWLREDVIAALEDYDADPSQAFTSEQIRQELGLPNHSSAKAS